VHISVANDEGWVGIGCHGDEDEQGKGNTTNWATDRKGH
jgi:hypothetical protein